MDVVEGMEEWRLWRGGGAKRGAKPATSSMKYDKLNDTTCSAAVMRPNLQPRDSGSWSPRPIKCLPLSSFLLLRLSRFTCPSPPNRSPPQLVSGPRRHFASVLQLCESGGGVSESNLEPRTVSNTPRTSVRYKTSPLPPHWHSAQHFFFSRFSIPCLASLCFPLAAFLFYFCCPSLQPVTHAP